MIDALKTQYSSSRPRQSGFSLIELMVAMVLGLIVSAGIITLFSSTSKANRVQTQLARMQEQGRFTVQRVVDDLRMGTAQFCNNSGGLPSNTGSSAAPIYLQDRINTPLVLVNAQNVPGINYSTPAAPAEPYPLPADFYMRGYECTTASCIPATPTGIPDMGTAEDDRIIGTDMLTLRGLRGTGWSLNAGYSVQIPNGGSEQDLTSITLAPSASTEPPASHFQPGDLAMLAECNRTQVFAVNKTGNVLTPNMAVNFNTAGIIRPQATSNSNTSDPRLYDFSRDFVTTSYFLQLRADDNPDAPAGRLVGALMRQVNNQPAQELVRGVERLDFRYGVVNKSGAVAYLTADQVDSRGGGSFTCPAGAKDLPPAWLDGQGQLPGCLWRAVKTIEISMLLNSVGYTGGADGELAYTYPPDGNTMQTPPATPANGLERNMMRRSFTTLVSVRNNTL